MQQARLVREGRLDEADLENIAEELESMARAEAERVESLLDQINLFLLKCIYVPEDRGRVAKIIIGKARIDIGEHLENNPSLQDRLPQLQRNAYAYARRIAALETDLPPDTFPKTPPFTLEQVMQDGWMPEDAAG